MKNLSKQSCENYYHKMYQIYEHIDSCNKKQEPTTTALLKEFLKTCLSPNGNKKGCATEAIYVMVNENILLRTKDNFYAVKNKNIDDKIRQAAVVMVTKVRKRSQTKVKKQDVVQPALFTESVMREQEQPIVTASDQLRQRIAEMESKLNTIITFFKTL